MTYRRKKLDLGPLGRLGLLEQPEILGTDPTLMPGICKEQCREENCPNAQRAAESNRQLR